MQDVYDLIFQESKPEEEEDVYSSIFKASKEKPEIPELELPKPEPKDSIFERTRDFSQKLKPFLMGIPGFEKIFPIEKPTAPPMGGPVITAPTPREIELAETGEAREEILRTRKPRYEDYGGWLNYLLQEQPGRAAMWMTAFAGAPVIIALFEAIQQVKNIGMSLKEKSAYDPRAQRMLSEMVPEDAPGWLKGVAVTGEVGADMLIAGLAAGKINSNLFRRNVKTFFNKAKEAGWPEEKMDEYAKIVEKYAHRGKVEKEIERTLKIARAKIPSPLERRIAMPEAYEKPSGIKMPERLAPPTTKFATETGVVFEPGVPEAEVLKAGYRAVEPKAATVNIMPKADGSVDVTWTTPGAGLFPKKDVLESLWAIYEGHPKVLYKDLAKHPYVKEKRITADDAVRYFESKGKEVLGKPKTRVIAEKKPVKFKDPLHQEIYDNKRIKPNQDYSRKELLKILPPKLVAAADDPAALAMDKMAQVLSSKFPFIDGDVELYDELKARKVAPVEKAFEKAERERAEREYEDFKAREEVPEEEVPAAERRKESRFLEQAREKPVEEQKEILSNLDEHLKELKGEASSLRESNRIIASRDVEKRVERIKEERNTLEGIIKEKERVGKVKKEEKPAEKIELQRIVPLAKAVEKALRERKPLTERQREFLKERGVYEEAKKIKAKPLPEPEIEKLPERLDLVKVSIETPTGEIEDLGEITVDRLGNVKKYAKQFGVEGKLRIGKPYKGKWGEYLHPKEIETYMKEVIRDVKKVPKEEWELYFGYPFTEEVKKAIVRIRDRIKTKKRIKLEELEKELKKTDTGKVEWMFLETERQLKEKRKPSFQKAFKATKRALVDTSGNVKKELIKNLGPLGKEATIHHDLIAGASAKAERLFEEASKEIYKGLSKDKESLLNRAIQSRRTIAISGYKPEVKHPMGLTVKEHEEYMKTIPEETNKRADRYFKEMEKVLDDLKSEGLIDEQAYQNLKSKGDYSPRRFIQYIDPERTYIIGGKTITVPDSGIKALDEGSYNVMETNSRTLLSSVISRTQARIFRNRANKTLYELAKSIPDNGIVRRAKVYKTTKKGKPVYQKAPAGHTKIKAMIDGKSKEMIMPDEYAKEWLTRDPLVNEQLANIIGWLSGSKFLKPMATGLNPGFALTNFPRDIAHVWIVTSEYSGFVPKFTFQITRDFLSTAKDTFLRKGRWIDYIDEGGGMTFLTHQGRPFKTANKKIKTLQQVLGYLGETSEIWTRLALRERAIRGGASPHEATWIARNYLDFSQGGNVSKALDTGIPYLNAGVQGTRGIFRAAADRPYQTLWKFAQLGTIATGLYFANNYLNKDCYEHITDREKVNNFIITTPFRIKDKNGNIRYFYFKIAKDQGQRVVCTIFENLVMKMLGRKINADQVSQSVQEFLPIIPSENIPPSLDAMLGYYSNKDFWTREDIWKGPKITPREEYTIYTHPALVKAGKATGISPERLEYSLSQLFTRGNIYTSLVGGGLSLVMKDLPEKDKRKTLAEIVTRFPLIRRVCRLTPPYSVEDIKKQEKASIEESTRRYQQRRELNEMANRYYGKLKDEKIRDRTIIAEANAFIKKQPKEDRKRLVSWFENYGRIYDVPNKSWWLNLSEMPPEARATEFWLKYLEEDEKERIELKRIAKKMPGLWSPRFRERFNILIRKWRKGLE